MMPSIEEQAATKGKRESWLDDVHNTYGSNRPGGGSTKPYTMHTHATQLHSPPHPLLHPLCPHLQGLSIVHCDLKPENIMLRDAGGTSIKASHAVHWDGYLNFWLSMLRGRLLTSNQDSAGLEC